jgi:hypothetical protein
MCSGIWFRNLWNYKMPNTYYVLSFASYLYCQYPFEYQLDIALALLKLGLKTFVSFYPLTISYSNYLFCIPYSPCEAPLSTVVPKWFLLWSSKMNRESNIHIITYWTWVSFQHPLDCPLRILATCVVEGYHSFPSMYCYTISAYAPYSFTYA